MQAIRSGSTTSLVYFDGPTGLSSGFTVWRSRNGATAVQMSTPTIAEVSNMTGTYALTLDEDTTIDSGFGSQVMRVRVLHASLPQGRANIDVVIYRNDLTHVLGSALQVGGSAPASPVGNA